MTRTLKVSCYRAEGLTAQGRFQEYDVPVEGETSLQDILMYISENIDPTLAFFKHAACRQGLCGRCTVRLNGKTCLACTASVPADSELVTVEPVSRERVTRDLLCNLGSS
jgi:succinate dehydrogenase/fumarate reductase-like Fe-S protein